MTNIQERLDKHYNRAYSKYGEAVLGVFLYGSWNYNTNTPNSDVDTKCILIPNLYSLAIKPYETKHLHMMDTENDEVCECMTIMHMVSNWKKQNINFLEVLFTPYCIINPSYKDIWEKFTLEEREQVARYDLYQTIHSMAHQAIHTLKQNPEDPKKYMNAVRISNTLARVLDTTMPYWECLQQQDIVKELRFKTPDPVVVADLILIFEHYLKRLDEYSSKGSYKPGVDSRLNQLILDLIQYRIEELVF